MEVVRIIIKTSLCNVFSDSQQCCIEVPPADHVTNILNIIFVISDMSLELIVRCDESDPINGFKVKGFAV